MVQDILASGFRDSGFRVRGFRGSRFPVRGFGFRVSWFEVIDVRGFSFGVSRCLVRNFGAGLRVSAYGFGVRGFPYGVSKSRVGIRGFLVQDFLASGFPVREL